MDKIVVKPLEWRESTSILDDHHYKSTTVFENIMTVTAYERYDENDEKCGIGYLAKHSWDEVSFNVGDFSTLDEAKAACQKYHEKLVKEELLKFVEIKE